MKRTVAAAGVLLAAGAASAAPPSITPMERQRLVAHLEMSESWLVDEVSGLSPGQLKFRTAPGVWTIMEVLDHLVVSEAIYWENLQAAMKATPRSQPRLGTDADILWYGIDRTNREKAVPAELPKGQVRDLGAALDTFRRQRAVLLRYAKSTDDDLRGHLVERQGCDAYQWLLLISSHAQRHILQIREVKAELGFPKK